MLISKYYADFGGRLASLEYLRINDSMLSLSVSDHFGGVLIKGLVDPLCPLPPLCILAIMGILRFQPICCPSLTATQGFRPCGVPWQGRQGQSAIPMQGLQPLQTRLNSPLGTPICHPLFSVTLSN